MANALIKTSEKNADCASGEMIGGSASVSGSRNSLIDYKYGLTMQVGSTYCSEQLDVAHVGALARYQLVNLVLSVNFCFADNL